MRAALGALLCIVAWGAVGPAAAGEMGPRRSAGPETAAGETARVIVKFRADASVWSASASSAGGDREQAQFAGTLSQRLGLTLADGRALGERVQVLQAASATVSAETLAARLAADPDVEYAVPSLRRYALSVPDDPLYAAGQVSTTPAAGQWYLRKRTTTFRAATNAQTAWDLTKGRKSITVAVLDTGVRRKHEDLAGNVYTGYDFISDKRVANDGTGRDGSAYDPGDWVSQSDIDRYPDTFGSCSVGNSSWHGTQVSGLIAAIDDNGIGMTGIAPNVRVLPVRVLGKCGGDDADIIAAMLWAGGLVSTPVANPHPARVINMSLGSAGSCSSAYRDAVRRLNAAGVVVVAAAGNDSSSVGTPANCAGVIAVGALRHNGTKVGYSNFGSQVAISAPGGNCVNATGTCLYPILSTSNTGTTKPVADTYTDGTDYAVGTSFSSPLVAGTAALMLSVNPALTARQVRSLLRSSARAFPTTGADSGVAACSAQSAGEDGECYCTTATCGAGMLDTYAAVKAAKAAID